MGVACQILINKPKEGVYKPGRPVTGKVKYAINKPTEYQDVTLSFLGKGKCSWTEYAGKVLITYTGSEDYITTHVNVTNKKPEETITLQGEYEYPFEFYMPEDIPSSYRDSTGSITYRIQLKFVKPNYFSFNNVFTAEIPVSGTLEPATTVGNTAQEGPLVFGLEKTLFAVFKTRKPKVNLKAEIAKSCLSPGEDVHLTYEVTNDTGVAIPSVKTDLYCYTTFTANGGETYKKNKRFKQCTVHSPEIPEREVKKFTCVIPTLPELYSVQHSKVISREYRVRATVRLPMPYINAIVEMPIVLGKLKGSVEPCLEAFEDADQPPSYWEAMNVEKCDEKKEKE